MDIKAELYRDFYFDRFHREGQPPTYQRRGSLQLWQFLVALLDDPSNSAFIAWTGRGLEFKLIEPEEVNMSRLLFYSEHKQCQTLCLILKHGLIIRCFSKKSVFLDPVLVYFLSLCEYLYTKLYHAFMYKYSVLKLIHYCICVPGCTTMGVTEEQTRNELR